MRCGNDTVATQAQYWSVWTMSAHHRESQRHPCRLRVRLVDGAHARPAITADVSARGLFVRTDEHWVPNALVRLHVTDPDEPRPLALLGIVTRCVDRMLEPGPGIGVSLFGNGESVTQRWQGLVRRAAAAAVGWTASLDAEVIDPIRRGHTRRPCMLDAMVAAPHAATGQITDASEGGLFLSLPELPVNGSRLQVTVRRPDLLIEFDAQVVRGQDSLDPLEKGVGLALTPESSGALAWASFLMQEVPLQRSLPTFLPQLDTLLPSKN